MDHNRELIKSIISFFLNLPLGAGVKVFKDNNEFLKNNYEYYKNFDIAPLTVKSYTIYLVENELLHKYEDNNNYIYIDGSTEFGQKLLFGATVL